MRLRTLDEFIQNTENSRGNAYVNEPGFKELYVRRGPRFLDGRVIDNVLDIARITAREPGKGTFTQLSERLLSKGIPLYVECVLNPRFAGKLRALGFTTSQIDESSFYKLPHKEHAHH